MNPNARLTGMEMDTAICSRMLRFVILTVVIAIFYLALKMRVSLNALIIGSVMEYVTRIITLKNAILMEAIVKIISYLLSLNKFCSFLNPKKKIHPDNFVSVSQF